MPMPIDAVIFDADGTLVDSEVATLEVLLEHSLAAGVPFAPGENLLHRRGQSMRETVAQLGVRLGRPLPDDFEATMRAALALRFEAGVLAMPGALEVLQGLRVPFCVATNGPRAKAELTLRMSGLLPLLQGRIFSAYEVGSFKPDPGLLLAAAEGLGVHPTRCALVEDSLPGMQAGLAAGMQVYAVPSGEIHPPQLDARVRPIASLAQLLHEPWHVDRGS
jgi:HAD superfamily hydrolase (TIGR01509 family)